jgi:flagellin-specific chaperone FliS
MAMTLAVAEKGLASLSTEQLLDLYTGVAEVYGAALMYDDKEIIERSQELLRQLNEAFEEKSKQQG